jgi:hypothetical protein
MARWGARVAARLPGVISPNAVSWERALRRHFLDMPTHRELGPADSSSFTGSNLPDPDFGSREINLKLLLRNEFLAAENRILRAHLPQRLRLADPERNDVG